jgi:hypothetical protein
MGVVMIDELLQVRAVGKVREAACGGEKTLLYREVADLLELLQRL